jgi:hypothetical protein
MLDHVSLEGSYASTLFVADVVGHPPITYNLLSRTVELRKVLAVGIADLYSQVLYCVKEILFSMMTGKMIRRKENFIEASIEVEIVSFKSSASVE